MNTFNKLCDLRPGELAEVVEILHTCPIHRRLCDIGLIENTPVKCLFRNPGDDMRAYLIRGAVIALRNEDCAHVVVKKEGTDNEIT